MDLDETLRRAAADLRTAATSPRLRPPGVPDSTVRPPGPRARLVVAAVAATVLAAVWLVFAGTPRDRTEQPAGPSPSTSPTSLCGSGLLPTAVVPPKGWTQAAGPVPGAPPRAVPRQLVVRFTGPQGASVEARWPAAPDREDRPWTDAAASDDLAVGPPGSGDLATGDGVVAEAVLRLAGRSGACRFLAVTWYGPVPTGYGTGWGSFATRDEPAAYRRAVQALVQFVRGAPRVVSATRRVDGPPSLTSCPPSEPARPAAGEEAHDQVPLPNPDAALQRFVELDTSADILRHAPRPPFTKLVGPKGQVWYTAADETGTAVVYTERTTEGWVVVAWQRDDGC